MTVGLTRKQIGFMRVFCALQGRLGRVPTYDELAASAGICSRGNVGRYVRRLCERGWLAWATDGKGNRMLIVQRQPPPAAIEITNEGYAAMAAYEAPSPAARLLGAFGITP